MKVVVVDDYEPFYVGQILEVAQYDPLYGNSYLITNSPHFGITIPMSYVEPYNPATIIKDNINPSHYKSTKGFECIDVIEEVTKDLSGIEAVATANAIKYLYRWKKKNGIEDCRKSLWYIQKLITHLENEGK